MFPSAQKQFRAVMVCKLIFQIAFLSGLMGVVADGEDNLAIQMPRTVHVVGMVPYPGENFVRGYSSALKEYLDREVGCKFDPPVNFSLRSEVCLPTLVMLLSVPGSFLVLHGSSQPLSCDSLLFWIVV
eukprot:1370906-Rhodomonas_salina.1